MSLLRALMSSGVIILGCSLLVGGYVAFLTWAQDRGIDDKVWVLSVLIFMWIIFTGILWCGA